VLEDDSAALVVLWDCRFRVGCEETRSGSVSGRAFVFVDETVKRVGLLSRVEHGNRERQ
jgi:hypothetical protein